ncbi:hypothetical protein NEHOM01_2326 [Nematocida homosporus]|uniref:uncharacterized protein n=1 Tax=Nematocida homosporus TaxID=1912981 RepID=UPI00221F9584|nr:uncharacterized protein NEHOM01_2326 [Nematocida homosporus]KAI5187729.1 hypothetical protein NEHOM01_2326 [Nematocida homosporus]
MTFTVSKEKQNPLTSTYSQRLKIYRSLHFVALILWTILIAGVTPAKSTASSPNISKQSSISDQPFSAEELCNGAILVLTLNSNLTPQSNNDLLAHIGPVKRKYTKIRLEDGRKSSGPITDSYLEALDHLLDNILTIGYNWLNLADFCGIDPKILKSRTSSIRKSRSSSTETRTRSRIASIGSLPNSLTLDASNCSPCFLEYIAHKLAKMNHISLISLSLWHYALDSNLEWIKLLPWETDKVCTLTISNPPLTKLETIVERLKCIKQLKVPKKNLHVVISSPEGLRDIDDSSRSKSKVDLDGLMLTIDYDTLGHFSSNNIRIKGLEALTITGFHDWALKNASVANRILADSKPSKPFIHTKNLVLTLSAYLIGNETRYRQLSSKSGIISATPIIFKYSESVIEAFRADMKTIHLYNRFLEFGRNPITPTPFANNSQKVCCLDLDKMLEESRIADIIENCYESNPANPIQYSIVELAGHHEKLSDPNHYYTVLALLIDCFATRKIDTILVWLGDELELEEESKPCSRLCGLRSMFSSSSRSSQNPNTGASTNIRFIEPTESLITIPKVPTTLDASKKLTTIELFQVDSPLLANLLQKIRTFDWIKSVNVYYAALYHLRTFIDTIASTSSSSNSTETNADGTNNSPLGVERITFNDPIIRSFSIADLTIDENLKAVLSKLHIIMDYPTYTKHKADIDRLYQLGMPFAVDSSSPNVKELLAPSNLTNILDIHIYNLSRTTMISWGLHPSEPDAESSTTLLTSGSTGANQSNPNSTSSRSSSFSGYGPLNAFAGKNVHLYLAHQILTTTTFEMVLSLISALNQKAKSIEIVADQAFTESQVDDIIKYMSKPDTPGSSSNLDASSQTATAYPLTILKIREASGVITQYDLTANQSYKKNSTPTSVVGKPTTKSIHSTTPSRSGSRNDTTRPNLQPNPAKLALTESTPSESIPAEVQQGNSTSPEPTSPESTSPGSTSPGSTSPEPTPSESTLTESTLVSAASGKLTPSGSSTSLSAHSNQGATNAKEEPSASTDDNDEANSATSDDSYSSISSSDEKDHSTAPAQKKPLSFSTSATTDLSATTTDISSRLSFPTQSTTQSSTSLSAQEQTTKSTRRAGPTQNDQSRYQTIS